jgi:hypothetical protein
MRVQKRTGSRSLQHSIERRRLGGQSVFLSYHVLTADGSSLMYDNPRAAIPFVLIPGDSHCMAIDVPTEAKDRGGPWSTSSSCKKAAPGGVAATGNALTTSRRSTLQRRRLIWIPGRPTRVGLRQP